MLRGANTYHSASLTLSPSARDLFLAFHTKYHNIFTVSQNSGRRRCFGNFCKTPLQFSQSNKVVAGDKIFEKFKTEKNVWLKIQTKM